MNPDLNRLTECSGELLAVTGDAVSGDRFVTLFLRFKAGTLKLACDDDTDEIIASVIDVGISQHEVRHHTLTGLGGLMLDYVWELRNQRGYVDGLQLRLRDSQGREVTVQFEVGASAMDVRRVVR